MIERRGAGNLECARAGWGGKLVFYARQDSRTTEPDGFVVRVKTGSASAAQTAAQGVSTAAQSAAQGVSTAAQSAAAGVSKGVRQGVYSVRVWAAPQLESAADYTAKTVAPKVYTALRTSAQQVRPVDQKKSRSALTWSLVAAAVFATAGAVAALVRYRDRASTTTGEEEFAAGAASPGTGAAETATAAEGASNAPADSTAGSDAGVNGRVSSSGW
jgi:hypothetical protein